jgi:hypothetical protein
MLTRIIVGSVAVTAFVTSAGPALATECGNADKPVGAGVQVVIDPVGTVVWATPGLEKRFGKGLVDQETGEGFHGLIGFDFNGDGVADSSTYIAGPNLEIPETAQFNGPACHGIVDLEDFFEVCVQ